MQRILLVVLVFFCAGCGRQEILIDPADVGIERGMLEEFTYKDFQELVAKRSFTSRNCSTIKMDL